MAIGSGLRQGNQVLPGIADFAACNGLKWISAGDAPAAVE
jgi:hypothetical protein